MHRPLIQLLLLALAANAATAGDGVQASDRSQGLTMVNEAGAWRVESAGEEAITLDLEVGFRPRGLASLDGGWLATGTVTTDRLTDLVILRGGSDGVETLPTPAGRVATAEEQSGRARRRRASARPGLGRRKPAGRPPGACRRVVG